MPDGDVIRERARDVSVVRECDVCVLGGGRTGVFAAVRAAQMGASVALVEKQNVFGGAAVSGLVAMWHKLCDNKGSRQIIDGLTGEVVRRLQQVGAVTDHADGPGNSTLNTSELTIELDRLVLEHDITPYLHTIYAAPQVTEDSVEAVFIENKNGRQAIRAKVFVDATGDGDLAKDAGIPFKIRDGLQPPTTCAKVSGLPETIDELIGEHGAEFGLAPDHGWGARIPGSPGVDSCACTHVFGTVASDAIQLTTAEIEGRRHVRAYMDIARRHGGQSNRPCLLDLGSYLGVRETRSLEADYTLTESDAMSGRRFPDAIANGTYPIDVHDPRTGRFEFSEPQGDFYQIPLACLVSNRAPSTVLAGRTISAGRGAFGAIRVMVNLNQTGEAAGVTAALAAAGRPVREVEPSSVRERLSELGAVIV